MRRQRAVVEGSSGDAANNHSYERSRWRGLERMTIQNLLIATIQNIRKLIKANSSRFLFRWPNQYILYCIVQLVPF
jgi:hypothetical protein